MTARVLRNDVTAANMTFHKMTGTQPGRATFGEILQRERVAIGAAYNDVANNVGATKAEVRSWERDEAVPRAEQLHKLCGMFRRLRYFAHLAVMNGGDAKLGRAAQALRPKDGSKAPPPPDDQPDPRTFGEALRQLRVVEGLDQDDVAELVGVTGQAVSAWERAVNRPCEEHYAKLCDVFTDLRTAPKPPGDLQPWTPTGGTGPRAVPPPRSDRQAVAPPPPAMPQLPAATQPVVAANGAPTWCSTCEGMLAECHRLQNELADALAGVELHAERVAQVEAQLRDAYATSNARGDRADALQRELDELHGQLEAPEPPARVTVDPMAIVRWTVQVQTARTGDMARQLVALLDTASDLGLDLHGVLAVLRNDKE